MPNAMASCPAEKCSANYAEKPQFHSSESGISFQKNQMNVDLNWFVLVRLAKTLPWKLHESWGENRMERV
jgi:hypothetical protein